MTALPNGLSGEGERRKAPSPGCFAATLSHERRGKDNHTAFLKASARSVFSHEKPPSASGVRPKCP